MKTRARSAAKKSQTIVRFPAYEDLVWVQCKGYRCMAYPDSTGQWINFYTGGKLTDFIKVIG